MSRWRATRPGWSTRCTTRWLSTSGALVEEFVHGRELDVAVIEHADGTLECGPVLEIGVPDDGIFDTAGKYDGEPDFRIPAPLDDATRAALEEAARTMFRALGCRGLARVDFFLTADGIVLNEVNTFPGFTSHSQVPRMFAAAGVEYPRCSTCSSTPHSCAPTAAASGCGRNPEIPRLVPERGIATGPIVPSM